MNKEDILSICCICNKRFKNIQSCSNHIINFHKEMRNIENRVNYFLKYIAPLALKYELHDKWKKNITNKCLTCNKETEFISFSKGFKNYCCKKCQFSNKKVIQKCKDTWKNKTKEEVEEIQNKIKKTTKERYGVENIFQDTERIKAGMMRNHGVDNPSKLDWVNEIQRKANIENKETRIPKYKETCLERYGVDSYSKLRIELSLENFSKRLESLDYVILNTYEPKTKLYQYRHNHIIEFIHKKCNTITTFTRGHIQYLLKKDEPNICPNCYPRSSGTSLKEQELASFIKKLIPGKEVITNTKTVLPSGMELDIYIPDYNFAIEFNGIYWHSDIHKNKEYHLDKTKECESIGIHLFHIFEDEWDSKNIIIKYKILNKLKFIKDRIHTRKCLFKKLESKKEKRLARRFLDLHHIQGRCISSIYYGLIYDNNIVAIMSFSNKRRAIFGGAGKKEIELVRFASHLKYNIPGAASKLFKYVVLDMKNKHTSIKIISYADKRFTTNIYKNLYENLEFKLKRISSPNYYYFDGEKRYHRYNFRKSVLVEMGYDKGMTEFEITDMMGLLRIWDCGNFVYEYKQI